MVTRATAVNPAILRWARERALLSIEDVAASLKKAPEVVASWEAGEGVPTFGQLEKMAERLYKRPVALFFFPHPPEEEDPSSQFRTLPDFELDDISPDTSLAVREARSMQLGLREITGGSNPAEAKIFRDIRPRVTSSPAQAALDVRDYLGVEISTQLDWKDTVEAFKAWRSVVEDKGVFVFKRAFKQGAVSGFCLDDDEFPVIYINNSTAHARQSFTLFHELAHVLLGFSSLTKSDYPYMLSTTFVDEVEVWCNKFATQLLVPRQDFRESVASLGNPERELRSLAKRYRVSRQVVLRRLLDEGIVSRTEYRSIADELVKEFRSLPKRGGDGGNYYYTQATYLGDAFLRLAFSRYHEGRYSLQHLAEYLNMKARNVGLFEDYLLRRA